MKHFLFRLDPLLNNNAHDLEENAVRTNFNKENKVVGLLLVGSN